MRCTSGRRRVPCPPARTTDQSGVPTPRAGAGAGAQLFEPGFHFAVGRQQVDLRRLLPEDFVLDELVQDGELARLDFLGRARFLPAEVGGHKVMQHVQQAFQFSVK